MVRVVWHSTSAQKSKDEVVRASWVFVLEREINRDKSTLRLGMLYRQAYLGSNHEL
jgi:hypothetical protein